MNAPWIFLSEALEAARSVSGSTAWLDIQERLKRNEISTRAAVIREYALKPRQVHLPGEHEFDERVPFGPEEEAVWLHADIGHLPNGPQLLKAGEEHLTVCKESKAATVYEAGKFIRQHSSAELQFYFWKTAYADVIRSSAFSDNLVTKTRTEAYGIVLKRKELEYWWPPQRGRSPRKTAPENRGGRPPKYDWEAALIFVTSYIYQNGIPENQTEIKKLMVDWFAGKGMDPDDAEVRKRAARIYKAFKR